MWMNAKVMNVRVMERGGARVEVGDIDNFGRHVVYLEKANVLEGQQVKLNITRIGVSKSGGVFMAGEVFNDG